MKELKKYPLIGLLPIIILLPASCSREVENSVSPPIDSSTIPPTPSNLSAEIGDGFVVLSWDISDVSLVSEYNIYQADSAGEDYSLAGNTPTESFITESLQNGVSYYFKVAALNSAGYEGYKSEPVTATPGLYGVLINGGDEYTNNRVVSLGFTAPVGTRLTQISNDSSFSGSQWETFTTGRSYQLESGDGPKTVYCRFRDASDKITWRFCSDSIILDTEAFIDSVRFSPSGPFSPEEVIHFAVFTAEVGGDARILIGSNIAGIDLFDNGQRGDATADDGIYEVDYTIPALFDFEDEIVYGQLTDRAGNDASILQANNVLSVRRPPDAVTIFNVTAPPGYHNRLDLNWEASGVQDFAQYRLYRSNAPGLDSTDMLVATIISRSQTSFSDTGLIENTAYYYRIYVVDITGLWNGSNEASATTALDFPPEPVNLYPVIMEPDYYQEVEIEWSQSPDIDFQSYRLYRWQEDIGRGDSVIVAFITGRTTTVFTDQPDFNTSEDTLNFWYILHVYDNGGNSTPSDSVRAHLVDGVPPTVSGSVAPSDSSLIVTWSQSNIPDFGSYRLLRDIDDNPAGAITVFVSGSSTIITHDDDTAVEGQTYFYWLDIYDLRGNSSRSDLGNGAW